MFNLGLAWDTITLGAVLSLFTLNECANLAFYFWECALQYAHRLQLHVGAGPSTLTFVPRETKSHVELSRRENRRYHIPRCVAGRRLECRGARDSNQEL